jgi:fructoselysine 6-kinase
MLIDEQGERYSKPGSWNGGVIDSFMFNEAKFGFINSFDLAVTTGHPEIILPVVENLRAGTKLAVDFLHFGNFGLIDKTLNRIDIAFIAGNKSMFSAANELAVKHRKPLVITMGAEGSRCFFNGESWFQEAIGVNKVVDTTGCGDAYQAAFAFYYFKTGNLPLSMLEGAKAASVVLSFFGGVGA